MNPILLVGSERDLANRKMTEACDVAFIAFKSSGSS